VVTESRLAARLVLRWGEDLADAVAEIGPPEGGSFLVTPGPRRRPVHASLAPSAAPGGRIVARVLAGGGAPQPVAVSDGAPRVVTLASAPLALAARDDGGFWALHPGQVVQHDAAGGAVRSVAVPAVALVPAAEDGVWAVTLDEARRLDADGRELGRFPWRGGPGSAPAAGGELAAAVDGVVHVLTADGATTTGPAIAPHERLLAAGPDATLTAVGGGLRRHAGTLEEIPLQAAGLTSDGRPWTSGRAGPSAVALRVQDAAREVDVGAGAPAQGALRVVSVAGDALTVLGPADAWELEDGGPPRHRALDEAAYRDAVFPVAWELTATAGTPSGSVLLAASGPPGAAVLELAWA
jgi:hypothetical protein